MTVNAFDDAAQLRRHYSLTVSNHMDWWTTSGGSTFIPSGTEPPKDTSKTSSSDTSTHASTTIPTEPSGSGTASSSGVEGGGGGSETLTTFTTSYPATTITESTTTSTSFSETIITSAIPVSGGSETLTTFTTSFPATTITDPTTTFTSFSESVVTTPMSASGTGSSSTASGSAVFSTQTPGSQLESSSACLGHGLDSSTDGLLASIILPSVIGLIIWLVFAILRPRFRQIYGLREWFVQQDLRPKPLGSSFFAFLFPHVPLIPKMPSNVSDAGHSASEDASLFPSDEQLSQRALWIAFLIVLGWTVIALGGALPLYLVSTPCIADLPSTSTYGGGYSALSDLSLMRLLRLVDSGNVTLTQPDGIQKRADSTESDPQHIRARIIVLTVLTLVLGLLPALWKIIKEFNNLVAYRKRWVEVRCEGLEMGWLSARHAPGFVGWGEKRLKDFILKTGLSSSLETSGGSGNGNGRSANGGSNGASRNNGRRGRRSEDSPLNPDEAANLEVDIKSLFSINDTQHLAFLIDERDEILENLEIAETRYIRSFRLTTPDPSIADYEPPPPEDPSRPYISRPKPLNGGRRSSRKRRVNPAFAASSLAPTSFVAPSQYYKLRGVHGVTGGRFADSNEDTFTDSINSRVVGSRFQEVNRNSMRLPLGSYVRVDEEGRLGASDPSPSLIPDPRRFGPNYSIDGTDTDGQKEGGLETLDEEWDLMQDTSADMESEDNGPRAGPSTPRRRPLKEASSTSATRRETFPFRKQETSESDYVAPPHLRLQPSQPFVRPMDGIAYDDLGAVYGDITQWRSRLKSINAEISDAQRDGYTDIADGARIKGWLIVGRGLRHVGGVQLIEGRAKEDIRWDVLQNERNRMDSVVLWCIIGVVIVLLGCGLAAVAGLAIGTAPDMTHYFPFLSPLLGASDLAAGLATVFAPAVAASVFIFLALAIVHWAANIQGSVSVSGGQLFLFKLTFSILTAVAAVWLITIGAVMFALQAFSTNSGQSASTANGSIYMAALAVSIIIQVAIIFPGLLMLQPFRLWHVIRAERQAVTPRQRFRAVYPRTYNPSFATGACILAIIFASTFALIFPVICPAVVVLLFLTLIAHRFLVGYVFARTHSQTGGLLQIWLLRRFGTLLAFQPILLGLIFLSRRFWIEGGVLVGTGVAVIIFVETYTSFKTRQPGRRSLSSITKDSLQTFEKAAKPTSRPNVDEDSALSMVSSGQGGRTRGSMASVLEMMSLTLAVMPSSSRSRGAVPLQTETLDDLTATERAARTHPDAPPRLPPLAFTDHAEDMAGILYAPELIAPPPIIWMPNDGAGVARSEALDLQKYHDLRVTLDIRSNDDVLRPRRSTSSRSRSRGS